MFIISMSYFPFIISMSYLPEEFSNIRNVGSYSNRQTNRHSSVVILCGNITKHNKFVPQLTNTKYICSWHLRDNNCLHPYASERNIIFRRSAYNKPMFTSVYALTFNTKYHHLLCPISISNPLRLLWMAKVKNLKSHFNWEINRKNKKWQLIIYLFSWTLNFSQKNFGVSRLVQRCTKFEY